jgi:outer membrane protein assembly factor BamB
MQRCHLAAALLLIAPTLAAADWLQFRGPGGFGVAPDKRLPITWSDSANLLWKTALPGPGSSSPIVVGNKILVTCYSGYGLDPNDPGDLTKLKRQLVCLDHQGKILWTRDVATDAADARFAGSFITLHGYASSTPVSDGKTVYCFFGVAGVLAFDLEGKQLWRTSVGVGTNDWGSGSSPVLAGDHIIVNAAVESGALVALNKKDGNKAWEQKGMEWSWVTPLVIDAKGRSEVIVSIYNHLRAFDPKSGKELWNCEGLADYVCPSLTAHDGVVFAIGARDNTAIAVRAGGTGDVSQTHHLWTLKRGSNVSSPIYHDGHLYWASDSRGVVYCVDANSGKLKYEERLDPDPDRIYASAFLGDGKIYYVSRNHGTYVIDAKPEFKQIAHNTFANDTSVFNGSPAAMVGKLLLRSDRYLYCVGKSQ